MALLIAERNGCGVHAHRVEPHAGQCVLPLESRKSQQGTSRHSRIQEEHYLVSAGHCRPEESPAFFSSLGENDIVNVRLRSNDVETEEKNEEEDALLPLRRARVLQLLPEGVQVQLDDGEETDAEKRIVELKDIEQRVQVPWKPRDLADNFIVFRRRLGRTEEYIEDLRVRRNFVRRILDLLMEPGFYRPCLLYTSPSPRDRG